METRKFFMLFPSNKKDPLRAISLKNMYLSRSLKVKSNGAVGLPIYEFLLVSNSNYMYMSNWHRLGVIAT